MKFWSFLYIWLVGSLILALSGCNSQQPSPTPGPANLPVVMLSNPKPGEQLETGREIKVQSTSIDPAGIARVELVVNGEPIWVDANAQPQPNTPFIVAQPWLPRTSGRYILQARAYNTNNLIGVSAPLTVEVETVVAGVTPATATAIGERLTPTPTNTSPSGALATATSPSISAATPTSPGATPTATPAASPTPPGTPTPTPRPQEFEPTGLEPEGRFWDIWFELGEGDSRLGYPTGPVIAERNYAQQYFEKGLMFWWDNPDNPDTIWVLDTPTTDWQSGATSNRYNDTWQAAEGDYSCELAREGGPVRGFGKLWCERPELQTRLGYPREPERGSGGAAPYAQVQFFQGGVMIYNPANAEVFVLFDQGDWRRFEY